MKWGSRSGILFMMWCIYDLSLKIHMDRESRALESCQCHLYFSIILAEYWLADLFSEKEQLLKMYFMPRDIWIHLQHVKFNHVQKVYNYNSTWPTRLGEVEVLLENADKSSGGCKVDVIWAATELLGVTLEKQHVAGMIVVLEDTTSVFKLTVCLLPISGRGIKRVHQRAIRSPRSMKRCFRIKRTTRMKNINADRRIMRSNQSVFSRAVMSCFEVSRR